MPRIIKIGSVILSVMLLLSVTLFAEDLNQKLIAAVMNGDVKTVSGLLSQGADVNAHSDYGVFRGTTALIAASMCGDFGSIKALSFKSRGFNGHVDIGDPQRDLKNIEADEGKAKIVRILLDNGADANAKTDDGMTALIAAAYGSDIEITKALLDKGADPNARTNDGTTALGIAIKTKHSDIADLLKQAGAKE